MPRPGRSAYRIGICDDDPEGLRTTVEDQVGRSDLIITTGGTATGPGDMIRRVLGRDGSVRFTEVTLTPCGTLGYGSVSCSRRPTRGEIAGDLPARGSRARR